MEEFPVVHTNFWDAIIAVPIIILVLITLKVLFPKLRTWLNSIANVLGLFISIVFAHPGNLWAGIFIGVFYGNAAIGVYFSYLISIEAFRNRNPEKPYR
ncbi:hypothetical protein IHV10_02715 [Fictibacillus sp. 5RED26]|uniref:hypothetical protein n=1 Tax=Fictibacillus sp. 5RED26 TaxID=2745876 RepID=UPI0018CE71B9|nr:hypothetical protein [Fictibacillus sp. 5RED26]MBH0155260.1 hypothetical protein [Fictibacillus sp. 5RED26]